MNKELIKEMQKETDEKIKLDEKGLARAEIMERFVRRQTLVMGEKADVALGNIQTQIRNIKKSIKHHHDFNKFLTEIENE